MLTRLRGLLEAVEDNLAIISSGDLCYEIMLSGGDSARLAGKVGQDVELELLHYLESQSNGAILRPRLVGFASRSDRAFFELSMSTKAHVAERRPSWRLYRRDGGLAAISE